MKKNKYLHIIFVILMLFSFNNGVNADTKGYCLYNTKGLFSKEVSFMLKQDSKGNITYYYAEGKPTDDTSKDWVQDSETYDYKINKDTTTPLTKCPNYLAWNYYKDVEFYNTTRGTGSNAYYNIASYKATINVDATTNKSNAEDDGKIISSSTVSMQTCEDVLGEELISIIQDLVNIVKIGVPIILVVLGTVDFGKAILSSDENEMKKAQGAFIKRLIIAVAIFLIPAILGVILEIANQIWGNIDTNLCGIEF